MGGRMQAARVAIRGGATASEEAPEGPRRFVLAAAFPNPTVSYVTLALDLPSDADVSVLVYDLLGRLVHRAPARPVAAGSSRPLPLEVGYLAPGTYVVHLVATSAGATEAATGRITVAR
jgi:hypothetical protein